MYSYPGRFSSFSFGVKIIGDFENPLSLLATEAELQSWHAQGVQPDEFIRVAQHALANNVQGTVGWEGVDRLILPTLGPPAFHHHIWPGNRRFDQAIEMLGSIGEQGRVTRLQSQGHAMHTHTKLFHIRTLTSLCLKKIPRAADGLNVAGIVRIWFNVLA